MGIIILLLPLALIFFMMQNQRKKAAAQQQLIASLTEGDDVMTTAGMYGTLTWIGKEEAFVEIADGVEIHIAKGAIARKVDMSETEAAKAGLDVGDGDTAAAEVDIVEVDIDADDVDADDVDADDDDVVDDVDEVDVSTNGAVDADDESAGPVSTPKRRWRGGGK
jgi:preprotein translocase subunit YajC